jgi:cytochrome c-type biogenesis protein CcmH/NrfF
MMTIDGKATQLTPNMDATTWVLTAIGGFIAVTALVRLMRRRRDELFEELSSQARAEQERKLLAEALERKKKRRAA